MAQLSAQPDVTLLSRTTAFGYYDGNLVGAVERVDRSSGGAACACAAAAPVEDPRQGRRAGERRARARHRLRRTTICPARCSPARRARMSTRYGVRPGARAVVFTNNDSAYAAALALHAAGVAIAAIVDARTGQRIDGALPARARDAGICGLSRMRSIAAAHGGLRVAAVDVAPLARRHRARASTATSCACRADGIRPCISSRRRAASCATTKRSATFVPDSSPLPIFAAGAANGRFDVAAALLDGARRGYRRGEHAGADAALVASVAAAPLPRATPRASAPLQPLWAVPAARRSAASASSTCRTTSPSTTSRSRAREGYQSVEHLKRYTTLGMGTDQGKTSNIIGLALLAEQLGVAIPQVGTTTFRPPYTPVTLGAIPGAECGPHVEPTRYSAMHDWHAAHGARFVNAGSVEAAAFVSARRRIGGRRREPRGAATCARTSASSTCRRSARSSCRDATSPSSSIASTSTAGTRWRSAAAATA